MTGIRATASATIDARPQTVYAILADYNEGHPRILPNRYFSNFAVESGGIGAGTIIRFDMRLFGAPRTMRAEIAEPAPGRVLIETDLDTGAVTSFTVESAGGGNRSVVTIETTWTPTGVRGWLERVLAPAMLNRVYSEELKRLNHLAWSPVRAGTMM